RVRAGRHFSDTLPREDLLVGLPAPVVRVGVATVRVDKRPLQGGRLAPDHLQGPIRTATDVDHLLSLVNAVKQHQHANAHDPHPFQAFLRPSPS
ncbi:MAG: hypothetical protein V3W36_00345, partial [Acidimicrobiia bacterium]